jgi:signal peptidase I
MGDHRSHSGDSRENYLNSRDVKQATIPDQSVVGRAFVVFWPFNHAQLLSVPDGFNGVPAARKR